jgi:hypothetical protein
MSERKLTAREMAFRYERYKKIVNEFDEFMCNNWTPDNVHSLWNELFSKYSSTMEEEE